MFLLDFMVPDMDDVFISKLFSNWPLKMNCLSEPLMYDIVLLLYYIFTHYYQVAATEFPWITEYSDRSMTEIEMRMILHKKYQGPKVILSIILFYNYINFKLERSVVLYARCVLC